MTVTILDKLLDRLEKRGFKIEFIDSNNYNVKSLTGEWFEIYENAAGETIYIYDFFNNEIMHSEEVEKIIDFLKKPTPIITFN